MQGFLIFFLFASVITKETAQIGGESKGFQQNKIKQNQNYGSKFNQTDDGNQIFAQINQINQSNQRMILATSQKNPRKSKKSKKSKLRSKWNLFEIFLSVGLVMETL